MADVTTADLTTLAILKSWADPNIDSARDDELNECIDRASAWIQQQACWDIGLTAARTLYFDGDEIRGPILFLPSRYRYVLSSTMPTVTEDGSALTVAQGYSTTADVIAIGLDERHAQVRFKRYGSWSSGIQNIVVTFLSGYAAGSAPDDIIALANEVAWLYFKAPQWIGRSTMTKAGHNVTFEKQLTPMAQATLAQLREHY